MKRQQGFTLVELLIVIVVFGILATVLFRTYNTIMRLSVRSEFQKNLQTDVLFVNQVMHSLADTYTIDYGKYENGDIDNTGMVETLYLVTIDELGSDNDKNADPGEGNDSDVTLRFGGGESGSDTTQCYQDDIEKDTIKTHFADNDYDCGIWYQKGEEAPTRLTSPQTYVTNVGWQLIPYQDNWKSIGEGGEDIYKKIAYPGVVMYWRAYHRGYGLRGVTDVSQVVQRFFTLTDQAQL